MCEWERSETAQTHRWRAGGSGTGREERRIIGCRGSTDRRVGSELSNLALPKVPDISPHHEPVLPPSQCESWREGGGGAADQINNAQE